MHGRTVRVAQLAQELLRGARRERRSRGGCAPPTKRRATSRTNALLTSSLLPLEPLELLDRLPRSSSGHVGVPDEPPLVAVRFTMSSVSTFTATFVPATHG